MTEGINQAARMLGVPETRVARELAGAIRRSEPDAREVYGVINGVRFVARRVPRGATWTLSLERRPLPWERRAT